VRGPRPTGVPLGGVLVAVLGGGAASIFWHVPGGMRVVGEG
jgi:hypothetical protein